MKVGILKILCTKINIQEKITMYKTIIAPHFDYCSTILFLSNESQINRLQMLQNRAMRAIMCVNRFTSISLMLQTLGWLSVRQRIDYLTLNFIHKIQKGDAPKYLIDLISERGESHGYSLGNNNNFHINKALKTSTQNSLTQKGFRIYNSLPNELKNDTNEKRFKKQLILWIKNSVQF